jgi:hypothetical protein
MEAKIYATNLYNKQSTQHKCIKPNWDEMSSLLCLPLALSVDMKANIQYLNV